MRRRDFLKNLGMVAGGPILLNGLGLSVLGRSSLFGFLGEESDRVLVLVQLNGGNDGLNTVIPLNQYDPLANARPSIVIPPNQIIPVTDTVGFHPSLTGLKSLYDDGRLGIVHSVGYPDQNRSHFRSIEIWSSGSPADEIWNTGWAGRFLDQQYPGYPTDYPTPMDPDPFAISMGFQVSETCQGSAANFAIALNNPFSPANLWEWEGNEYEGTLYGYEYEYVQGAIAMTNKYTERIAAAANSGANAATYPDTGLAEQLKNVALLISGGLKTRVYTVSLGGFDTHAGQAFFENPGVGTHADLLKVLSDAIKAFEDDLKAQGLDHRVLGMTFSEFGRQIKENGSLGTDHGTAAPMILFGACTEGKILGDNPVIPANVGAQEGVPMQFDFRDVYGTVLTDWLGVDEASVQAMLYPEFQHLPMLDCGNPISSLQELGEGEIDLSHFPNPFSHTATIRFSGTGEWLRLSVFDALGHEIRVLAEGRYGRGPQEFTFNASSLPAGNYYCRLQLGRRQKTMLMVKVG